MSFPLVLVTRNAGSGGVSAFAGLMQTLSLGAALLLVPEPEHWPGTMSYSGGDTCACGSERSIGCRCGDGYSALLLALEAAVSRPPDGHDTIAVVLHDQADPIAVLQRINAHPRLRHQITMPRIVHVVDGEMLRCGQTARGLVGAVFATECVVVNSELVDTNQRDAFSEEFTSAYPLTRLLWQQPVGTEGAGRTNLGRHSRPSRVSGCNGRAQARVPFDAHEFLLPDSVSWLALHTWLVVLLAHHGHRVLRAQAWLREAGDTIELRSAGSYVAPVLRAHSAPGDTSLQRMLMLCRDAPGAILERSLRQLVHPDIRIQAEQGA